MIDFPEATKIRLTAEDIRVIVMTPECYNGLVTFPGRDPLPERPMVFVANRGARPRLQLQGRNSEN